MAGMSETYCVIGVRADSSRHVMAMRLSPEDAGYLKEVLLKAEIFREVLIQQDEPQPVCETPDGGVSRIRFGSRNRSEQPADHPRDLPDEA
jgi:hypothetical protein